MARNIIISKSNFVLFLLLISSLIAFVFMSEDERYVAGPAIICILIVLWLGMRLWERDKQIPFFDVGFFCAIATLVYTVFPLLNYWVNGFNFGVLSDFRLQKYNISPNELGLFHIRNILYLFSFVLFYITFRGKGIIETGNTSSPSRSTENIIVLLFVLLTGYFVILRILTGINFNVSYEPDAYASNRSAFANAPLILVQISKKLGGILFLFKLAVLYFVVSRSTQRKWRIILLIWVAIEIVNVLIIKGARTGLFLFLLATVLFYHRMVKQVTFKFLIISGASLFIFFIFLGLYRQYIDFTSFQQALENSNAGFFSGTNEFQAIFGTAYDVLQLKEKGIDLPWYLYLNDFINILPPQQLLPVEKIPAWDWYLREIGLSGTGLGLMWGVISQSIVGLDWIELAFRGAILGYILARFHQWYLKRQTGFFETIVYVFYCVKIYYTFRDTTGSILTNLIWEIIPFYIILRIIAGPSLLQTKNSVEKNVQLLRGK